MKGIRTPAVYATSYKISLANRKILLETGGVSRDSSNPAQEAAAQNALRAEVPVFIRDGVLTGLLIFALSAAAVIVVYQTAVSAKLREALNQLRPQAEYLASLVDLRAHAWLVGPDQTNSQPHTALTQRLQNVRQYYPGLGKLFTGRYQNGKIHVILDTHHPDRGRTVSHSVGRPLDMVVPPDAPEIQAIEQGETYLSDNPAFKGEGNYLGIIVPLANPNMGVRDFLYLDSSHEPVAAGLATARKARDVSLLTAGLFAIIAGGTVFSWRCQSRFRQLLALTKLRDGEELFRSTYEMSPVAMSLLNTDGIILKANKAFCDLLGYTETELMRLQPADYIHAKDLKSHRPLLEKLQNLERAQFQTERRYVRKDGRTVWGLVSMAIVRDSDANISHYMAQVVDITERKEAEDTLRLNEERLALAAAAGKVGMWDGDLRSGHIVWNEVMHRIHHTEPDRFSPTFASQEAFVHEDDRATVTEVFQRCVRDGSPYEQEYRITLPGGGIRHIKGSAVIFRDDKGQALRAVGTCIDITAEKEESQELIRAKESALAADKAKSEFLAVMSHEIRTPLNGVLGFVSMLKNTHLDSEQLGFIETMESSGQGLLALVNDILDLSKIESREIHVEPSTFEIRPFIRRIHQQLDAQAYAKELHYDFFVEYSVPKSIHTDPIRLGQILTNLLGNAVKFTDSGRVELCVSAKPRGLHKKEWDWTFSVRDTGPGIPEEALPNLFKLFYQVDSSATRRHGGTGLGLAISERLARLLGGGIRVESRPDEGSTFTLTIAAPRGESTPGLARVLPEHPQQPPGFPTLGKKVLVVEDNPVNRKLCALQLKRLGCETEFAETGFQAVEKVRKGNFDVVLMDMQLPDLDGCGATREIRREERTGEHLRIIALTANAMPEDRKRCLDAGMDDFLSKPLRYETLATTLAKWS